MLKSWSLRKYRTVSNIIGQMYLKKDDVSSKTTIVSNGIKPWLEVALLFNSSYNDVYESLLINLKRKLKA
jgi:hypothetical protein